MSTSPGGDLEGWPKTVEDVADGLKSQGYFADHGLASAMFVADRLRRPLFLEGAPGVGKTEAAKAYAAARGAYLIRLQCYEGIDAAQALYDWNYSRQMLYIRALEQEAITSSAAIREVFSREFLIRRPLLEAIESPQTVVLLIDEIDRSDDEFEAFLLELLAEYQVTIPELGTIRAASTPVVILTSNRTREVHDALKRRSLYHWIDYPDRARELEILRAQVPEATDRLAVSLCGAVERMRKLGLHKPPGIGETLDWARTLTILGIEGEEAATSREAIGAVLKVREDQERALAELTSTNP